MAARPRGDDVPGAPADSPLAVSAWLREQETKDLLRFVTIGSVDDGKSTLIGRLLHDAHGLYQDQLAAVRRASLKGSTRGAGSASEIDFSLFTDGLLAEREQGITIDVAYRYFATDRRKFIIADTPGHVQYTRNMATGASTADVAVILVDARHGVIAQTRRHAHIAALLGIPHVVACVNKMDLVAFDRGRFDAIVDELRSIAARLGVAAIHPVPVSALAGDNVARPSAHTPWWTGGTLLELLESLPVADDDTVGPFRLPVQLVLRPGLDYRGFAGRIASGTIAAGDEIVALPSGKRTRVAGIDVGGREVPSASAPLSVALRLVDEIDVSRGDMLASASAPPVCATELTADLVWMSERPLDPGRTYLLKHTTRVVRAAVRVLSGTDPETLEPAPAETLALNDIGRVLVACRAPLSFDPYRRSRKTGAFILVDSVTNDTVAAGMIAERTKRDDGDEAAKRTQVGAAERRERLGQAGVHAAVLAPTLDAARALAFAVERELFDRGRVAYVVEGPAPEAAGAVCARAGLIALVPGAGAGATLLVDGAIASSSDDADVDRTARAWAELLADRSAAAP
ncbi:MAG: 50S ribosome-binding GTPase [Labilithrix sp.]|nr:50S ribosome-binding GTPase [Labilithrix sp.]